MRGIGAGPDVLLEPTSDAASAEGVRDRLRVVISHVRNRDVPWIGASYYLGRDETLDLIERLMDIRTP